MGVFGLVYDEDAVQAAHAFHPAQRVLHELLVVLHVLGIDLYKEIVITAGVEALCDFLDALHGIHELLYKFLRVLF